MVSNVKDMPWSIAGIFALMTLILMVIVVANIAQILNKMMEIKYLVKKRTADAVVAKDINRFLHGQMHATDVTIEDAGEAEDKLVRTSEVVNMIMENQNKYIAGHEISFLIFSSVVYDPVKNCLNPRDGRLAELFRVLSMLHCKIDWVHDIIGDEDIQRITTMFVKENIRCDRLLNSEDITVRDLELHDVVFHPHCGVKSAYEITAEIIKRNAQRRDE